MPRPRTFCRKPLLRCLNVQWRLPSLATTPFARSAIASSITGARCGGGGTPEPIVPYVTGVGLFTELVRILANDEPENIRPITSNACSYHFITLSAGKVKAIGDTRQISEHPNVLDFELFVEPEKIISPIKVGTDRSGFMIVTGNTVNEAYQTGVDLEKTIEVEYY